MAHQTDLRGGGALSALADPADWADLHALVGPGTVVRIKPVEKVPDGPGDRRRRSDVQLVDTALRAEPAPEAVRLGPADVPEILDLVARTRPGPLLKRTIELGTHLGIGSRTADRHGRRAKRDGGPLPAEGWGRIRPPGWTEISAVCTDPEYRGRGLATRLVRAVATGIRERGDAPFLHAAADNAPVIRWYESIGFTLRRRSTILLVRSPGTSPEVGVL